MTNPGINTLIHLLAKQAVQELGEANSSDAQSRARQAVASNTCNRHVKPPFPTETAQRATTGPGRLAHETSSFLTGEQ